MKATNKSWFLVIVISAVLQISIVLFLNQEKQEAQLDDSITDTVPLEDCGEGSPCLQEGEDIQSFKIGDYQEGYYIYEPSETEWQKTTYWIHAIDGRLVPEDDVSKLKAFASQILYEIETDGEDLRILYGSENVDYKDDQLYYQIDYETQDGRKTLSCRYFKETESLTSTIINHRNPPPVKLDVVSTKR